MVIRETTLCVLTASGGHLGGGSGWGGGSVSARGRGKRDTAVRPERLACHRRQGRRARPRAGRAVSASPPPMPILQAAHAQQADPHRRRRIARRRGFRPGALRDRPEPRCPVSTSNQPSLFWYLDGVPPGSAKIEFTLIDDEGDTPLIEATLKKPDRPGLHRIDLSDYGVNLSAGKEYEWSVSIIMNPADRSQDIVATGWIERVARSEDLSARLASEGEDRSVHVFADEGLWYDALTALGDQMQRNPGRSGAERRCAHRCSGRSASRRSRRRRS